MAEETESQKQQAKARAAISEKIARYKKLAAKEQRTGEEGVEMMGIALELFPVILQRAEAFEGYVFAYREQMFYEDDDDLADPEEILHVEEAWVEVLRALGRIDEAEDNLRNAQAAFEKRKAKEAKVEQARKHLAAQMHSEIAELVVDLPDDRLRALVKATLKQDDLDALPRQSLIGRMTIAYNTTFWRGRVRTEANEHSMAQQWAERRKTFEAAFAHVPDEEFTWTVFANYPGNVPPGPRTRAKAIELLMNHPLESWLWRFPKPETTEAS